MDRHLESLYPGEEESDYEELPAENQPVPKITQNQSSAKVSLSISQTFKFPVTSSNRQIATHPTLPRQGHNADKWGRSNWQNLTSLKIDSWAKQTRDFLVNMEGTKYE